MTWNIKDSFREIFNRPAKNNPVLDGVRAISIIYVIIFHTFFFMQYSFAERPQFLTFIESLPKALLWVWHGDLGVDIFFLLSGFLIGQHLLNEIDRKGTIDLKHFYKKRAQRILPLYIFGILLFALANAGNKEYFWTNLLFINNLIPAEKIFIPWSWSLTIEGQFYFIVPFLLLLLTRWKQLKAGLLLLIGFCLLYSLRTLQQYPTLYQQTAVDFFLNADAKNVILYAEKLYIHFVARMGPLFLGVLIAAILKMKGLVIEKWAQAHLYTVNGLILAAAGTIFWILSYESYIPSSHILFSAKTRFWHTLLDRNAFALSFGVLLLVSLLNVGWGRFVRKFLASRVFFPVAQTSYALYLFHPPFLFLGYFLLFGSGKITELSGLACFGVFGLGFLGIFLFGCLTYIFIERPFLVRSDK